MKTEYALSQENQNIIDELNERLTTIELSYAERISKFPFMRQQIRNDFMNDPTVKLIHQEITNIYERTSGKLLITFETEEELKTFKQNCGLESLEILHAENL